MERFLRFPHDQNWPKQDSSNHNDCVKSLTSNSEKRKFQTNKIGFQSYHDQFDLL